MAMTEAQFREFWAALGNVVRIAVQLDPVSAPEAQAPSALSGEATPAPARDPGSTTSATAERAWSPVHQTPATARAFGFGVEAPSWCRHGSMLGTTGLFGDD